SKLDPALLEHLVQDRTLLKEQIQMLTKLMSEFCGAVLDAGSDGLFLTTQHFNSLLSASSLNDFEFQPLKALLDQYHHKSAFNVLHLHGNSPFFHKATELPHVSAINWHDQRTKPSLLEARQHFDRGLLGGLDEMGILKTGTRGDIEQAIYSIHRQFNDWGLMFAPGCVLPLDIPDEHLTWVAEAINSLQPIG
ncbi:MAG: uroporphyrinogen decarboxylase family protein, partial [Candidatus Thorarchaeota archaeon]